MKNLFFKIQEFGMRRIFVLFLTWIFSKFRVYIYRFFLSDNSPDGDLSNVFQAVNFIGKGRILIQSSNIGFWPSPKLLSSNSYIEQWH